MLIDSHCHLDRLDLTPFPGGLAQVLTTAAEADVGYFLCVGIDLINSQQVKQIADTFVQVVASIGLHPTEGIEQEPTWKDIASMAEHPKVVAIGETGLDYYRSEANQDMSWQQERFRQHIRAAKYLGKPLIVHTRVAREDTLRILREEKASDVGGVLHCFTEDLAMAEAAIALNFYISFSGIITFANAKELQAVAQRVPLERILIETDAPYLSPVPYRGKPNQPAYVCYVAEQLAHLRGISLATVAEQTTQNFFDLFQPPLPKPKFLN
jgi:TatD DNase family protein